MRESETHRDQHSVLLIASLIIIGHGLQTTVESERIRQRKSNEKTTQLWYVIFLYYLFTNPSLADFGMFVDAAFVTCIARPDSKGLVSASFLPSFVTPTSQLLCNFIASSLVIIFLYDLIASKVAYANVGWCMENQKCRETLGCLRIPPQTA